MIRKILAKQTAATLLALTLSAFALNGCSSGGQQGQSGETRILGAGATFPNPLYQKWFSEYNKINPGVKFDYQSIGSGGGIKQFSEQTVDFGGTDAPMKDEDMKNARGGELFHIPTVLGAVVLTYNLPGVQQELMLTPEAVAGIFLGTVTKWNDPAIVSSNEGVTLPASNINAVYRADGSGTTFVFTDYLSKVSAEWKEKVGAGTSVRWPVGGGSKGNEGVTGQVKQSPNSIGYVELVYAKQQKLPVVTLKNAAGQFVKPALESITAAAASVAGQMPDDMRVSITNAPGPSAYPVASFTYLLVSKNQADQVKGKALVDFLWWATHDGQKIASEMDYAPLPAEVVTKAEQKIKLITSQGQPLRASL